MTDDEPAIDALIASRPKTFADAREIARCILLNIDRETMSEEETVGIIAGHIKIAMKAAVRLAELGGKS